MKTYSQQKFSVYCIHVIVQATHFDFLFIEKSCSHPDITSPTIANGTLEINGKRQGGLQVTSKFDKRYE